MWVLPTPPKRSESGRWRAHEGSPGPLGERDAEGGDRHAGDRDGHAQADTLAEENGADERADRRLQGDEDAVGPRGRALQARYSSAIGSSVPSTATARAPPSSSMPACRTGPP